MAEGKDADMSEDHRTLPYPAVDAEHPTLVLPGEPERAAHTAPAERARRWPWVLLVVVVVLGLFAVAAELLARSMLPGVVRGIVIDQLDLPADQRLDVEADGILLPQLLGGSLDALHLSTDEVTVQGITGAVDVTATGVPLRAGGDLGGAKGSVRIDEAQFAALLADSDLPIDTVVFDAPNATLGGSVSVLGISVPIALTVTPGIAEGDLELTPDSLSLGGLEVDAAEMASSLGSAGERLTRTQRICIADQLPAGVMLTGLTIEGSTAVIDVEVDGAILTDAALQANGVCPAD